MKETRKFTVNCKKCGVTTLEHCGHFDSKLTQATLRYKKLTGYYKKQKERSERFARWNSPSSKFIRRLKCDWRSGRRIGDYNPHFILQRLEACLGSNWHINSRDFYGWLTRIAHNHGLNRIYCKMKGFR